MKPQTIRIVDAWVGAPLCWILTLVRRVLDGLRRPPANPPPPKKIIFIKLVELGANVQAYAAVRRAIEMVGRANVYFWIFAESRPILELLDLVPRENLLTVRSQGFGRFAADLLRTLWLVRRLHIDAVVDLEFFARASALLAFLSGARRRVGLHRFTCAGPYRGDLMTHRVQHNPYTHVSVYFYLLVEALGAPADELPLPKRHLPKQALAPLCFQPTADEICRVQTRLDQAAGLAVKRPIVLLNPNASDIVPLRKWPTERFAEVGQRLLARYSELTIIVTGSPSEQDAAELFVRQIDSRRAVSMAGQTLLRELLILYGLADVLVTNDSGPGQFAALTDIDSLVLFGPETPQLWGPLGPRAHVLWAGLACSPCINPFNFRFSPCRQPLCMTEITVDQVVEAVDQILERRLREPSRPA
ncbi:MAG: glycosyltransferase family 9 protein [Planctomycetota bacterium]|nr:glycosyltransferase family 9 protein [Planctomycetota bacterium]